MKLKGLIIFCILISETRADAQNLSLALHAGITADNINYTSTQQGIKPTDAFLKAGYHFSADLRYVVNERFSMLFEPGFINKGAITSTSYHVSVNLQDLSLPVLFAFKLLDDLSLELGPEFAYLIAANTNQNGLKASTTQFYSNRFEVSAQGGLSYTLSGNFSLGACYNVALTPVSKLVYYNTNGTPLGVVREFTRYAELFARVQL